ncbi:MAG TPA: PEP-CTERM sorting domain-containing protein [Tepidisphaeraceae bacterium]|jgi:hypothetical protein|nr:PEP-CTERM sorting domain-containing protein [Tepidisphaeraceae bacterium]
MKNRVTIMALPLFVAAGALQFVSSSASAAPLFYDGLDYTAGAIAGKGGWSGSGTVVSGSLAYTDGQGNTLDTSGGKLSQTAQNATTNFPYRNPGTGNGQVAVEWLSYLQQNTADGGESVVAIGVNSNNDRFIVGTDRSGSSNIKMFGGSPADTGVDGRNANFFLYRLDLVLGKLELWMNPSLDLSGADAQIVAALGTPQASKTYQFGATGLERFNPRQDGGKSSLTDEYRVGLTYADVTPHTAAVPEPASLAIVAMVGAGLLARRQRRS